MKVEGKARLLTSIHTLKTDRGNGRRGPRVIENGAQNRVQLSCADKKRGLELRQLRRNHPDSRAKDKGGQDPQEQPIEGDLGNEERERGVEAAGALADEDRAFRDEGFQRARAAEWRSKCESQELQRKRATQNASMQVFNVRSQDVSLWMYRCKERERCV